MPPPGCIAAPRSNAEQRCALRDGPAALRVEPHAPIGVRSVISSSPGTVGPATPRPPQRSPISPLRSGGAHRGHHITGIRAAGDDPRLSVDVGLQTVRAWS
jgi:hypothetical protein